MQGVRGNPFAPRSFLKMDLRINFSGRSIRYTEEEIALVAEVMRNAEPLTQGKYLQEFEKAFAAYQGVEEGSCFAVMNGASALELSAQLCCFKEGDEVVMPSHTFTASAYPYLKKGARLRWCDVDLGTHVVTAETIAKAMTEKTKAVVVVHLYGYVAAMDDCKAKGTKDKKFQEILPMLRHNGHCAYNYERPDYWKPAMGNVDIPMLDGMMLQPNNYSLGEVECALGTKLLERIDAINDAKRKRALAFIDGLADFPELEFLREETRRHNYHLLVGRMTTGTEKRDAFMRAMYEEKGIKCVVQYIPLNRYDYYIRQGLGEASCPNGDLFYDTMVSFPFQAWMSDEDFEYMLASTREVLAKIRG